MSHSLEMRAAREWEAIGNAIASLGRLHQERLAELTGTATSGTPDSSHDSDSSAVHTPTEPEQTGVTGTPMVSQPFNASNPMPAPDPHARIDAPRNISQESYGESTALTGYGLHSKSRDVLELAVKAHINSDDALKPDGAASVDLGNIAHSTVATIVNHNVTPQSSNSKPFSRSNWFPAWKADGLDGDKTSTYIDIKHYDEPNRPFAKNHPAIFYDDAIMDYTLWTTLIPPHPSSPERADASLPFGKHEKEVNLDSRRSGTASDHTDYFTYYLTGDPKEDYYSRSERSKRNPKVRGLDAIIEDIRLTLKTQSLGQDWIPTCSDDGSTRQQEDTQNEKGKGKEKEKGKPHLDTDNSASENGRQQGGEDSKIGIKLQTLIPVMVTKANVPINVDVTLAKRIHPQQGSLFDNNGCGRGSGSQDQGGNSTREGRIKTSAAADTTTQSSPLNRRFHDQLRQQNDDSYGVSNNQHRAGSESQTLPILRSKNGSPVESSDHKTNEFSSFAKHWLTPAILRTYTEALQSTAYKVNNDLGEMACIARNVTGMTGSARQSQALSLPVGTNMTSVSKSTSNPEVQKKKAHTNTAPATRRKKPTVEIAMPTVKSPHINSIMAPSKTFKVKTEIITEEFPKSSKTKATAERPTKADKQTAKTITGVALGRESRDVPDIDMARKSQTQSTSVVKNNNKVKKIVSTPDKKKQEDATKRLEAERGDVEDGKEVESNEVQTPKTSYDPKDKMLSKSARKKRGKKQREAEERQRVQEEEELLRAAIALSLEEKVVMANDRDDGSAEHGEEHSHPHPHPADSTPRLQLQEQQAKGLLTEAEFSIIAFASELSVISASHPVASSTVSPAATYQQLCTERLCDIDSFLPKLIAAVRSAWPTLEIKLPPLEVLTFEEKLFLGGSCGAAFERLRVTRRQYTRPLDTLISEALTAVKQSGPSYRAEPWEDRSIKFKEKYLDRLQHYLDYQKSKTQ